MPRPLRISDRAPSWFIFASMKATTIGKNDLFTRLAKHTARAAGHPLAFILAVVLILVWALLGPRFGYSDTWQLVVNTATTVITFLMVFLIQNTQDRDTQAIHLKLDELIRSHEGAHNAILDLEELSTSELAAFRIRYLDLAAQAREDLRAGKQDTDTPRLAPE
jgi:low affinity Fe/Cu permease